MNFDFNRNFCSALKRYVERTPRPEVALGWDFLGIPNPHERDFLKSGDFYPGDLGFLKSWDFYSRKLGNFISGIFAKSRGFLRNPRDFFGWGFFGDGFFFVRWDIRAPKSHFCSTTNTFVNLPRIFNYLNLSSLNPR